ncbi:zinc finger, CCHC-type containing protein [Tanacetum coccineum]
MQLTLLNALTLAPLVYALVRNFVPPEALVAHAAWVKGKKEVVELLQTVREFYTCKQEEGQSVSSHVLKMKGYIDNLEQLGKPVDQNLAVSLILVSLNKDFASFVQNFNMHGMGKTVNELHAMLKLHEEMLPKKDANPALHAIRAGRVQKNQKNKPHKAAKRGHGKGKGKMGYAPNNAPFAPKPKTPPPPKKDNPAKDAICHQCGEVGHWRRNCPVYLAELMKKKKLSQEASTLGALSLYVGDGHRAAVEAIGTYHLELPSGLVIVLNNCHYAPSITRGVISVSRLFDDGFINRFDDNNDLLVSKNNLVYFKAVPRNGIFEIDMSCSNTNDSSMHAITNKRAKINLDSSLLWHCRLGHISKKRIEKLQHDGLLNSIDIESLGKCVSCLSGKMARKPISSSGTQGSKKVYLDYTHRYMVRSMMSQTTLSKSFWDYALETSARILNMIPTKKVDKTPYEIWHGQAPKLSYLKVWGCEALVKRDTLTKPDKLDPRSFRSEASPQRNASPTDRLCLYIDAEEHELGDLDEPANYKAALLDPESKK